VDPPEGRTVEESTLKNPRSDQQQRCGSRGDHPVGEEIQATSTLSI
jgi:hypothetical protein